MPKPLDSFYNLLGVCIYAQGTLLGLTPPPEARRLELRPPRPGRPLTWRDQDEVARFLRTAARNGYYFALVSDGYRTLEGELQSLSGREIRFFRAEIETKTDEIQLVQASRLHASMLVTRLQMRGMLPRDLAAFGPHRGYQQLFLPAPFI